ncbi:MAG: hypothetical protein PHR16_03740 [Methylovulum sp.]|nr:hypothetical protein [Methylovulum sp.]
MTANQHRSQKSPSTADMEFSKPKFPAVRYFQIHFEHLESQLDGNQRCLETLKQQVARLEARLDAAHTPFDLSEAGK